MNIAKIIHSGIPKVGEAYMSDNISYDYSLPTAQKFQVIGYGDFYHPYINSGKYREVWKSGKYNNGIHISPSIFSKEIQGLIMLDKVLVINNND